MNQLSLDQVEALARRAHAGQVDKAGRPYAEHLAAVALGVARAGGDEEQIAAAWLHDSLEDGALREEWLAGAALSARTKELVRAMTKRPGEDPRAYAARIRAVPGARAIKDADMAHNRSPERLAVLDPRTRARLRQKYARMRRLLDWDPAWEAGRPERPCPGDPGDQALLAALDRDRRTQWRLLADTARGWRVEDGDCTVTTVGAQSVGAQSGGAQSDGSLWPGYPVYGDRVRAVVEALSAVGAVTPAYDWMTFSAPQLSWEESYSPADAVRAATAVVRGERFCDGTIGTAWEDGTLHAVTVALADWHRAAGAEDR
jgi:Family of unknown function (DUF6508)/HD domain